MSKKTKTILAVVLLLVVVAAAVGAYFLWGPPAQKRAAEAADAGKTHITLVVVHGDGSEKKFDIATDAETLDVALVENGIVEDNQSEWGLYILTADGETADESAQQWWCITKGGEMLMTGVDDTVIADGESYEFTLTVGW